MKQMHWRRQFLKSSAVAGAAAILPRLWFTPASSAATQQREPFVTAVIGVGHRGTTLGNRLDGRTTLAAVCDVDKLHSGRFAAGRTDINIYGDYRRVLDRKDIDAVAIACPDHWNAAICLGAIRSGKDVYCEKPATLTVDEGKILVKAARGANRIVQVGTQQRSSESFLKAVALVRSGRVGRIVQVIAYLGIAPTGGPFCATTAPHHLDWDLWLGQAPKVSYMRQRCHGSFRWWYEYAGGNVTDWGAHHVDVAQWAIGMEESGPVSIVPIKAVFPVRSSNDRFNTASRYTVCCTFPNGVELRICHCGNEVRFNMEEGRWMSVSRRSFHGPVIQRIESVKQDREWLEGEVHKLYRGREPKDHMGNFLDAVKDRQPPISDLFTHHRTLTTCHLANIALRTGSRITWDPDREVAVGDDEINRNWLARERRKGYELV